MLRCEATCQKEMIVADISVVIPAYNAGRTISATVKSVLSQTVKDLAVWIVNDGSTDDTGQIADEFARSDTRVHVIHQANAGGYMARRAALVKVNTPFVTFIDADDVIEETAYQKMLEFAQKENLDIVQCDIAGASTNGDDPEIIRGVDAVFRKVTVPYLFEGRDAAFVWNKLYRMRPAIVNIIPARLMQFDDLQMNLQFFYGLESIGYLHKGFYHYQINEGSSVMNFKMRNLRDFQDIIDFRRRMAQKYNIDEKSWMMRRWIVKNARNVAIVALRSSLNKDTNVYDRFVALLMLAKISLRGLFAVP